MKCFLTMLMAVLACLCLIQGTDAWNKPKPDDRYRCFQRNRDVGQVISDFCFGNKAMVVPSPKAREGRWSKKGKISIWIRGSCKPVQWVPDKYCHDNFFNMCVNMNKNNKARARYGNGGCQDWHIKQF